MRLSGKPPAGGAEIRSALMHLAQARGAAKTFCPSEAARALCACWRPLMPAIYAAARQLRDQGKLDIVQRGRLVSGDLPKGPIRLRLRAGPKLPQT